MAASNAPSLDTDGAAFHPGALGPAVLATLLTLSETLPAATAGLRLTGALPGLVDALTPINAVAAGCLGSTARPVRAVLFDKSAARNWALGWHQDRTIVVRARAETAGFGPWSRKQGLQHVAPPVRLLENMVTLRAHLDPCDADNAPLLAARGSHRLGLIPAADAKAAALTHEILTCLAEPGDVWAYSTLILHASDRATRPRRRRVLQVDYAAEDLPGELEWLGLE